MLRTGIYFLPEVLIMKRTDDLKKQVESATAKEEKKEAIQQTSMLPTDDELDQVSGGDFRLSPCIYNLDCPNAHTTNCHPELCLYAQGRS